MRLVLPVKPQAASRPRVTAGHAYYPARYQSWLKVAAAEIQSRWKGRPLEGPVHVSVFFQPDQIIVDIEEVARTHRGPIRGDLDNLLKPVLDALVRGGVLGDDRQVEGLVGVLG
jgi:Holliday junction resolvase RusA-like endonuclease